MGRRRIKAKDATEKERLDMCARILRDALGGEQ